MGFNAAVLNGGQFRTPGDTWQSGDIFGSRSQGGRVPLHFVGGGPGCC